MALVIGDLQAIAKQDAAIGAQGLKKAVVVQADHRVSVLAGRSILSGLILMWSRGISEFGAVVILTYHPMIAPVLLFERFQSFGLDYALPVAGVVILISMLVFLVLRTISRPEGGR